MTHKPSEELKKLLNETDIISYRTTDGSYIIAEEIDYEESLNVTYVASPLEFVMEESGRGYLKPWLISDEEEVVEIFGDKIVSRAVTAFELKMHYHRYFIMEKLRNVLTRQELNAVLREMFNPQVDNQDFVDEDESGWKVDNGISQTPLDFHMQWRKKHQGN